MALSERFRSYAVSIAFNSIVSATVICTILSPPSFLTNNIATAWSTAAVLTSSGDHSPHRVFVGSPEARTTSKDLSTIVLSPFQTWTDEVDSSSLLSEYAAPLKWFMRSSSQTPSRSILPLRYPYSEGYAEYTKIIREQNKESFIYGGRKSSRRGPRIEDHLKQDFDYTADSAPRQFQPGNQVLLLAPPKTNPFSGKRSLDIRQMLRRRPEKARLQLYRFQQQWNDQDGRIVFYRKPASSSLPLFSTSRSGQISEVIGQRQTKLCHRRLKPIRRRPRTSTRNGSKPEKKEALPLAKRSWSRLQKSTNSYPHQGSSRHSLGTHQECDRSSSRIVAKSFHNENDALSGSCHLDDNLDVKKYEQTMQSNRTRHDFCSMGPLKTVCKHWNQYQQQHRRGYQLLKRQFYRRLHQALRRYHRYRRNISILLAPLCNSEQGKSQHPIQSNHESPESLQSSECWQNKLGMAFTNGQLYSNHHDNVDENGRGIHIHSPLRTRQHPALAAIASNLWIRLALLLVLSMGGFFYCITMMEHQQWQIAGTGSNANWWADLGPSTRTNAATMSMAATAMRSITRSSASTETSGGQSQGTDSATTTNDSERTALESQTSAVRTVRRRANRRLSLSSALDRLVLPGHASSVAFRPTPIPQASASTADTAPDQAFAAATISFLLALVRSSISPSPALTLDRDTRAGEQPSDEDDGTTARTLQEIVCEGTGSATIHQEQDSTSLDSSDVSQFSPPMALATTSSSAAIQSTLQRPKAPYPFAHQPDSNSDGTTELSFALNSVPDSHHREEKREWGQACPNSSDCDPSAFQYATRPVVFAGSKDKRPRDPFDDDSDYLQDNYPEDKNDDPYGNVDLQWTMMRTTTNTGRWMRDVGGGNGDGGESSRSGPDLPCPGQEPRSRGRSRFVGYGVERVGESSRDGYRDFMGLQTTSHRPCLNLPVNTTASMVETLPPPRQASRPDTDSPLTTTAALPLPSILLSRSPPRPVQDGESRRSRLDQEPFWRHFYNLEALQFHTLWQSFHHYSRSVTLEPHSCVHRLRKIRHKQRCSTRPQSRPRPRPRSRSNRDRHRHRHRVSRQGPCCALTTTRDWRQPSRQTVRQTNRLGHPIRSQVANRVLARRIRARQNRLLLQTRL